MQNQLYNSILDLTKELIKIPSQGGIDGSVEMIQYMLKWGGENNLHFEELFFNKEPAGLLLEIKGGQEGETYCLNACLDTATNGSLDSWDNPPNEPVQDENWLSGRGSGDSKVSIAIFSHVAMELKRVISELKGTLHILFDAEEHTGKFLGIKSYVEKFPKTSGIFIGYPGNETICIGARGFYRAQIVIHGVSEHSGASISQGSNSIEIASDFIQAVKAIDTSMHYDNLLEKTPKFSVTEIKSGDSYSTIPDRGQMSIDVRLTTKCKEQDAKAELEKIADKLNGMYNLEKRIEILDDGESWPSYVLDKSSKIVQVLVASAKENNFNPQLKISGPSNIGNFLASKEIPAICGFGVSYKNIHAANEMIDSTTIIPVFNTYLNAIKKLML